MAIAQLEAETRETPWTTSSPGTRWCHTDPDELLNRFARELRIGAFEDSPDREGCARAILWRLTVAKFRLCNPEFLAANGIVPGGVVGRAKRCPSPVSGMRSTPSPGVNSSS
jgi:hypothetical protein